MFSLTKFLFPRRQRHILVLIPGSGKFTDVLMKGKPAGCIVHCLSPTKSRMETRCVNPLLNKLQAVSLMCWTTFRLELDWHHFWFSKLPIFFSTSPRTNRSPWREKVHGSAQACKDHIQRTTWPLEFCCSKNSNSAESFAVPQVLVI